MQISRIRSDFNLDTLAVALRDRNPEKSQFNRYAVVEATVGEGEKRAFLVEAHSKVDKDLELLKTAKADKMVSLTTKDASGGDVRVTGRVLGYTEIGNASVHRWKLIGTAAGLVTAGWVATVTALNGLPEHMTASPWAAAGLGFLALYGAVTAFGHQVVKSDGVDWAGITADYARESKPVPVEISGLEKAPPVVAALPAPTESPFILPVKLLEKQTA